MTAHFLEAFADPVIASRTSSVLLGAAAAGMGLLIVRTALPRTASARAMLLPTAQSGFGYLILGLASRFTVQHHRSRLQMVVLLGVVASAEVLRHRRDRPGLPRVARWLAGSVGVCLGVVAAKWALEPGALTGALSDLRAPDGHA